MNKESKYEFNFFNLEYSQYFCLNRPLGKDCSLVEVLSPYEQKFTRVGHLLLVKNFQFNKHV